MTIVDAPSSTDDIGRWAHARGTPVDDAFGRFVQRAVLATVAGDARLGRTLLLRGAAALRLFHGGRRPTRDLDFVVLGLDPSPRHARARDGVKAALNLALNRGLPARFPRYGRDLPAIRRHLRIDLSPCDTAFEFVRVDLPAIGGPPTPPRDAPGAFQVCTLEDVVADKLLAIPHPIDPSARRAQDVWDVADVLDRCRALNDRRVAELVRRKTERSGRVLAAADFDAAARDRFAPGYAALAVDPGASPPPLAEAWQRLADYVGRL